MTTEKDYKALTNEELGTQLMSLKNAKDGIEASIRKLIEEAESRGFAGKDIPTKGGEYIVHLTRGKEDKLNMDKAVDVLGAEAVANYLNIKRMGITTLTKTDLGKLAPTLMAQICDEVDATIKATVRKNKN